MLPNICRESHPSFRFPHPQNPPHTEVTSARSSLNLEEIGFRDTRKAEDIPDVPTCGICLMDVTEKEEVDSVDCKEI